MLSFKYYPYALTQQGIQSTTRIQRIQVVTTTNVLCINKNLRNRCTATALDHLFTLHGIAVNRKFLEKHKNKPVIVVDGSGMQCQDSATALIKAGFEQVSVLKDGVAGWSGENLPLVRGK